VSSHVGFPDFYDLERPGLGTEFLGEVEGAMRRLVEHPESSPVVLSQVRMRTVPRFPYSIVYSVRAGEIFVSAIAHGSRRPFYWQDRL
jgi:plasmid stabilization system protein ParE